MAADNAYYSTPTTELVAGASQRIYYRPVDWQGAAFSATPSATIFIAAPGTVDLSSPTFLISGAAMTWDATNFRVYYDLDLSDTTTWPVDDDYVWFVQYTGADGKKKFVGPFYFDVDYVTWEPPIGVANLRTKYSFLLNVDRDSTNGYPLITRAIVSAREEIRSRLKNLITSDGVSVKLRARRVADQDQLLLCLEYLAVTKIFQAIGLQNETAKTSHDSYYALFQEEWGRLTELLIYDATTNGKEDDNTTATGFTILHP